MTTTINYKTLTLELKATHNKKIFSKVVSTYNPNIVAEQLVNLVKPNVTSIDIEQTIFEEKINRSFKSTSPLDSFIWFLN